MTLYYKTKRKSKTGMKLQSVVEKIKQAQDQALSLMEAMSAEHIRGSNWEFAGGISAFVYDDDSNIPEVMKRVNKRDTDRDYMPKLNSKGGKALQNKIDGLLTVSKMELSKCVGYDCDIFSCIGFCRTNTEYLLFQTDEEWSVDIPFDCLEITGTEYKSLSEKLEPVS